MKDNKLHHLKKVWKLEQDTVNNVLDNINRKLAYTTIATTMRNLARKGFLSYTVLERTFLYQLLVKESEITHSMLSDLLERLFDNSAEKLVNTLLEIRQANPEEHNRLQQLIKDSQPRGNNDE
ncbi:TPA: BlaI/MecI/CopY family transcriptional regulator [Candidatus Poribacteria bacterium]|nr:BlaI/MecI/CopY family transcriptional regulator [Candidatus Poribacteria bacterium]